MVKKAFSDRALLLTTTDDEDFPSPADADAVKRYFVEKETRWTKRIKESRQKRASRQTKKKEKRFGQKLGIMKKLYTRQVENPTRATWAKKGIPVD